MPLAKSPITRGSLPGAKQKHDNGQDDQPMHQAERTHVTTPEADERLFYKAAAELRGDARCRRATPDEVVPISPKIKPDALRSAKMTVFPAAAPAIGPDTRRPKPVSMPPPSPPPRVMPPSTRRRGAATSPRWSPAISARQPPWNETLGPVRPRGGPNGLVLRGGQIVAEWGDTSRVDLTFSVAKSYLSILAGLAWDRGLIRDPHEPVCRTDRRRRLRPAAQRQDHLAPPVAADLGMGRRAVGQAGSHRPPPHRRRPARGAAPKGTHRDLQPPGTFWEYNDVRVNRLSLALLRLWRRPLPEVFRELVMDPIGASPDWEWHGYRNSWVEIDGRRMQSVSGGSHWGGGVFIHARDQARIGLMLLRRGMWGERRILSEAWIERMLEPCPLYRNYGYLWWLNTGRGLYPERLRQRATAPAAPAAT